jgi:hypothetical protein
MKPVVVQKSGSQTVTQRQAHVVLARCAALPGPNPNSTVTHAKAANAHASNLWRVCWIFTKLEADPTKLTTAANPRDDDSTTNRHKSLGT